MQIQILSCIPRKSGKESKTGYLDSPYYASGCLPTSLLLEMPSELLWSSLDCLQVLQLLRNRCTTQCRHIEMLASFQQEQCPVELLYVSVWVGDGELISSHIFFGERSLLNGSREISSKLVCSQVTADVSVVIILRVDALNINRFPLGQCLDLTGQSPM